MDIVTKIVTALGGIGTVVGLIWALLGFITFLQSKKNQDRKGQDDGLESILYGGILTVGAPSIAAGIIAALGQISF